MLRPKLIEHMQRWSWKRCWRSRECRILPLWPWVINVLPNNWLSTSSLVRNHFTTHHSSRNEILGWVFRLDKRWRFFLYHVLHSVLSVNIHNVEFSNAMDGETSDSHKVEEKSSDNVQDFVYLLKINPIIHDFVTVYRFLLITGSYCTAFYVRLSSVSFKQPPTIY